MYKFHFMVVRSPAPTGMLLSAELPPDSDGGFQGFQFLQNKFNAV